MSLHTSRRFSLWSHVRFGLLIGLIAIEAELVTRWARDTISGGMQHSVGIDGWWMGPLTYAVLFPFGVILVWLATRWLGGEIAVRATVVTAVAAGVAGVLFLFGQLHLVAVVLLAVGVGVQAARWVMRDPGRAESLSRRALPVVGALVVAAATVAVGSRAWREHRMVASLPAFEGDAPNVLLLILDTVRARNLHLYGYARDNTPVLDSLAREGVVFDYAWATAPWTLPSHGSIMTGRYPNELPTGFFTPLDDSHRTLAEVLAERGYQTGGFAANVYYATTAAGLSRGFSRYRARAVSVGQALLSASLTDRISRMSRVRRAFDYHDDLGRVTAAEVNARLFDWLDSRPDASRPFFAFLNYMEAHEPYLPPAPYRGRFGPDTARKNWLIEHHGFGPGARRDKRSMRPHEVAAEVAAYDESIMALDAEIGRLVASLRARGLLERTVLVITSDHGEQFGEHGRFDHANTLYRQLLHVPLLFVAPGRVPADRRIATPVSLRDLAATILDLTGSASGSLPGISMTAQWKGGGPVSPVYSEVESIEGDSTHTFRSLVADGLHYAEAMSFPSALFAIEEDTDEVRDLSRRPELQEAFTELQAMARMFSERERPE